MFLLQYFSVELLGQGQLAPESNTYESLYYVVVLPRFACLTLLTQSSLYQKTMKINPSIIEIIANDCCLFVGCILLIFFWDAFKRETLAL